MDAGPGEIVEAKQFDLTDYYYVRTPGRYTVKWPGEMMSQLVVGPITPLPGSAFSSFEIESNPNANADEDFIGKLLPLLKQHWSVGTGGNSKARKTRPGSNREEVTTRFVSLQYNPIGTKRDSGLVWLWLAEEPAAERPGPVEEHPPPTEDLGKLSLWHVYVNVSSNALKAWPSVKEDVRRALSGGNAANPPAAERAIILILAVSIPAACAAASF